MRVDEDRAMDRFPRPIMPWGFDVTPHGITLFFAGDVVVGPTCDLEKIFKALRPLTPEVVCLVQDVGCLGYHVPLAPFIAIT